MNVLNMFFGMKITRFIPEEASNDQVKQAFHNIVLTLRGADIKGSIGIYPSENGVDYIEACVPWNRVNLVCEIIDVELATIKRSTPGDRYQVVEL